MRTLTPILLFLILITGCAGGGTSSGSMPEDANPVIFLTTAMPVAYLNQSYTGSIQTTGGKGPYNWSVTEGMLPPGITMDWTNTSTVNFTGIPTAAGTWFFTVQVVDSQGRIHVGTFHITVEGAMYFSFPAAGTVIFVIDRSAEMAQQTSQGPTRLEAAQSAYGTISLNLNTAHDFDIIAIGAGGEVTSLFGSAVVADSGNLAAAQANVASLAPTGPCAMYSALEEALNNYGAPARVILLGGARPGTDSGAPGGTTDPDEIKLAVQGWLMSLPNTEIESRQFGVNSEVSLLYQNLAYQSNSEFYYAP